ncbi:hypothetical protein GCM10012287_57040 [Streptomyces daqingensis]|uniref:Uncharacterized protein n=1 Tax=Streptomyces daqingensis TaxID=1472640 RepID=A0ABQ2MTL3_9ACTN|nr:DUF5994 family protein [Streptomyces daqingensis]GGO58577.1 hypothetical protein GCM10012287_57040 [Streptomyces daqingensis]
MHVTADRTQLIHEAYSAPSVRLALKPESAPKGLLDGAWWPHSHNLLRELPALTDVLDHRWGRITRVSVNPTHWPVIPREVPVTGHSVKVGQFKAEQDPHKLVLLSYRIGRWDLLVIPPQATAATAARLMAAATDTGLRLTASALVAADDTTQVRSVEQRVREEEWESEGGTAAVPVANPRRTFVPAHACEV